MNAITKNLRDYWKAFVSIAKEIVNSPSEFFEKHKKEKEIKPALSYLAMLWIIGSLLTAFANIVFGYLLPLITGTQKNNLLLVNVVVPQLIAALLTALVGVVMSLALAIILHFWIKIFRGKGSLRNTINLNSYALTPSMLFGWLPIANIIASVFGVYLLIIGTEKIHQLNRKTTILMYIVIPVLLAVIFSVLSSFGVIKLPSIT